MLLISAIPMFRHTNESD